MDLLSDSVESLREHWLAIESPGLQDLKIRLTEVWGNFFEFRHSICVLQTAYQLARNGLGFSESDALLVAESAFLHDVGKEYRTIKRYFINREPWRDKRMWERLRLQHSLRGPYQLEQYHDQIDRYELLKAHDAVELTHYVEEKHHLQPHCLSLEKASFNEVVKIVAVADVFDVVTCSKHERLHRMRRPLVSVAAVANEIWSHGVKSKQLDPGTAGMFLTRCLEVDIRGNHIVSIPAS
jgi:hypothetical protein